MQQYYSAIMNAGATDEDLSQLLAFDDQELNEFISVLDMLPFHSIKFKKCLRELKRLNTHEDSGGIATNVDNTFSNSETMQLNELSLPATREFIISHATIYGKKKNRQLTSYEEAINNAALQLALENPLLISKKGDLFDLAKKKLLEDGYRYKRGSSRSKLKDSTKHPSKLLFAEDDHQYQQEQQQRDILAKRQENAQRMSMKRLEKIKVLQFQVEQALQCRQNTENKLASGDCYNKLTRLSMEADLLHYEDLKVKLTKEISKLKAQERKHQWYKRRKLERSASQSTDEGFSSQASSSYLDDDPEDRESEFSISAPILTSSVHPYSTTHYSSSQEYNADDEESRALVPSLSPSAASTTTTTTIITSKESDVRASSISNYDR